MSICVIAMETARTMESGLIFHFFCDISRSSPKVNYLLEKSGVSGYTLKELSSVRSQPLGWPFRYEMAQTVEPEVQMFPLLHDNRSVRIRSCYFV